MPNCKYCNKFFENGRKMASHQTWCKLNPNVEITRFKISKFHKNKITSQETKDKISKSRKKYLSENPEKVPYKLNHKHKETFPEKYFRNILRGFISQYRVEGTLYEIDFANPKTKIGIEIDGEQHYLDQNIIDHDKKRYSILESLGWKFIRIRWSKYKSLSLDQRKEVIDNIMSNSIDVTSKIEKYSHYNKRNKQIEKESKIRNKNISIENRISKIKSVNTDFSKLGWVRDVSKELNISPQHIGRWMKRYMPDFYEKCYTRKIPS